LSDPGRPRANRERWASDHERARQRAAERLSLPLPAAEQGWLDRHLRSCASCASIAADYAAQQRELNALEEPLPPRDLWARTATALDRAERQASRDLHPSVFPGRGGVPGSRGARSIRGLRAEQRASAFRAAPRSIPPRLLVDRPARRAPRPAGWGWLAPFGALAALAIVVVLGGGALLSSTITPLRSPIPGASASSAAVLASTPIATPIPVGAGEVAWLTPADDGSYSLNFASVDRVCPANAKPDCAPIAPSAPRHLPTVGSALHTVIRSPSRTQLVVVPTSTKKGTGGGSVIVVAVPTPVPSVTASATDTATPTTEPATPSDPATAAPTGAGPTDTPVAGDSASPAETDTPAPTDTDSAPPASVGPVTSDAPTPAATDAATPGSAGTPAATVEPSAPQPTAAALAIISDVVVVGETAAYSPDGTMLAFSARPADGSRGPDIYLWRPGDAAAHVVTSDHASVFSGWLSNQLLGSRALVDGVAATPAPTSGTSGGPDETPSSEPSQSDPTAPSDATPTVVPTDSTPPDAPAEGSPSDAAGVGAVFTNAEGAVSVQFPAAAATASTAIPQSFILDPITLVETDLGPSAWRPVVDPTGRFVAYWAGTLRYDAATLAWMPDRGALVLASWPALRGADPAAVLAPIPLFGDTAAPPPAEWDIRWDESGTHLAIWAADAGNPDLGRLTLLTVDAATGRIDPDGISLHDAPALAGFSIGSDRLAWATPPGQDGEGSRLQVLAWSGENAGNIDSQPAQGGDAVVVVR
jgi:hypothetical protein